MSIPPPQPFHHLPHLQLIGNKFFPIFIFSYLNMFSLSHSLAASSKIALGFSFTFMFFHLHYLLLFFDFFIFYFLIPFHFTMVHLYQLLIFFELLKNDCQFILRLMPMFYIFAFGLVQSILILMCFECLDFDLWMIFSFISIRGTFLFLSLILFSYLFYCFSFHKLLSMYIEFMPNIDSF